jgi:Zn-dependent protease
MSKNKVGIWGLIGKFGLKTLSVVAKSTKLLKFGLAAISFASYAYLFTWKFALLIMIALGLHESGHVWAMRKVGIKTNGFFYLPFIGGAAVAQDRFKTYKDSVFVSIMGPIWGFGLAAFSCAIYYITRMPLFAGAAAWMAMINLFNLAMIAPLDGGRIFSAIAFSINKNFGFIFLLLSLIAATVIMFKFHIGLFAFLIVIGMAELAVEYFYRKRENAHIISIEEIRKEGYALSKSKRHRKEVDVLIDHQLSKLPKRPASMNRNQIIASIVSYAMTTIALIAIVKLMAHIPGASLAANFLADK